MSGFPGALARIGLVERRPKACKHRKLSAENLALFEEQATLHAGLLTYKQLAHRAGMTIGSVRGLMAELIREKRAGVNRVRRGTNESQSEETEAGLM
jgi:hypothetical protein